MGLGALAAGSVFAARAPFGCEGAAALSGLFLAAFFSRAELALAGAYASTGSAWAGTGTSVGIVGSGGGGGAAAGSAQPIETWLASRHTASEPRSERFIGSAYRFDGVFPPNVVGAVSMQCASGQRGACLRSAALEDVESCAVPMMRAQPW